MWFRILLMFAILYVPIHYAYNSVFEYDLHEMARNWVKYYKVPVLTLLLTKYFWFYRLSRVIWALWKTADSNLMMCEVIICYLNKYYYLNAGHISVFAMKFKYYSVMSLQCCNGIIGSRAKEKTIGFHTIPVEHTSNMQCRWIF